MRNKRLFIIALALMTVSLIHPLPHMPAARAAEPAATATAAPTSNPQADALDMLRDTLEREPGVVRTQEENDTLLALTIGLSLTGFLLLIFSLSLALAIRPRLRRESAGRIDEAIEEYPQIEDYSQIEEVPQAQEPVKEAPRVQKKPKALATAQYGDDDAEDAQLQPLQTSKPVLGTNIDLDALSEEAAPSEGDAGNAERRFKPPANGNGDAACVAEDIPSAPLAIDPAMREAESQYIEDAFEGDGAGTDGTRHEAGAEPNADETSAPENDAHGDADVQYEPVPPPEARSEDISEARFEGTPEVITIDTPAATATDTPAPVPDTAPAAREAAATVIAAEDDASDSSKSKPHPADASATTSNAEPPNTDQAKSAGGTGNGKAAPKTESKA